MNDRHEQSRAAFEAAHTDFDKTKNKDVGLESFPGYYYHSALQHMWLAWCRALDYAAEQQAAPTWLPIETAPKDGTAILTVVAGFIPDVTTWVTYNGKSKFSRSEDDFFDTAHFEEWWSETEYNPTHWMPLPATPPPAPTMKESPDANS